MQTRRLFAGEAAGHTGGPPPVDLALHQMVRPARGGRQNGAAAGQGTGGPVGQDQVDGSGGAADLQVLDSGAAEGDGPGGGVKAPALAVG